MSKLLETLRADAEHLLEVERPTLQEAGGLLVAFIHRAEAELPAIAERELGAVLDKIGLERPPTLEPAPAAGDTSQAAPPAPAGADAAPIASQPAAGPAAGSEPSSAGAGVSESAPPAADPAVVAALAGAQAAGETPLDQELADARKQVVELEARQQIAQNQQGIAVSTDAAAS